MSSSPINNTPVWLQGVVLDPIGPELFNGIAKAIADKLAQDKATNRPTQLRKFYDEICMWTEKVGDDEERFKQNLPFIRMINSKAAYAKGRNKLVDDSYVELIRHCLSRVTNAKGLTCFKLFMEAVMGFYKEIRPKD
ncbi:MAG: type III-A CRISPR-associated protein Csm2 [Magnetococcales bacterium]|nr:type III-A CRISPR-associated protein Csm2 [Magnetococcales bacterium]